MNSVTTSVARPSSSLTLARALLGRAPGFSMCSNMTLDAMVESATLRRLNKSEQLSEIGLPVNELFMVVDGVLEASFAPLGGQRRMIGLLRPGDFEGVVGMLDGLGHVHAVQAKKSSLVLAIPMTKLLSLRERCPDLVKAMEQQIALRLRLTYQAIAVHGSKSLEAKLVRLLHSISCAYGLDRDGEVLLDMELSQAEIGAWLGATRQRVNVILQRLKDSGLIRASYSRITIIDLPGLVARCKE